MRQESKDKVRKLLGFFATVRLQQDWNAAKNNPLLLIDCPWEYFFTKSERILEANRKLYNT